MPIKVPKVLRKKMQKCSFEKEQKERIYPTMYLKFKFIMFLKCVFSKMTTNGSEQSPEADPFLRGNLLFYSGGARSLVWKDTFFGSIWEIG